MQNQFSDSLLVWVIEAGFKTSFIYSAKILKMITASGLASVVEAYKFCDTPKNKKIYTLSLTNPNLHYTIEFIVIYLFENIP